MKRRKGYNYLMVLADLLTKTVLLATPGKDAPVWEKFAAELLRHNGYPEAIRSAAIYMSTASTKGAGDNLGNGPLVYKKIHVIRHLVEACDQIRRRERRADAGKYDQLERKQWMWLKNPVNWTEREALSWDSTACSRL